MTLRIEKQLQRVARQLLHRETKTPGSDADLPMPAVVAAALLTPSRPTERARRAAGDTWQDSDLLLTTKYGTPIRTAQLRPRPGTAASLKRAYPASPSMTADAPAASILADLDVHPRVAMAILRHAQFAVTMEIYTEVSDAATRAGLKKLGDNLT